jgi:hypothetical protein
MSWETSVIEDTIELLEYVARVTELDCEGMIVAQIKDLKLFLKDYKKKEDL